MKKTYDAASAFTAMVNKTFKKSIAYKDFELMHQAIDYEINQIKQITTGKDNATPKIQPPMRILMMMSLLLHAREKNQVLNLLSLLVVIKVMMMTMTMIMKIMMMTLMMLIKMMMMMMTGMTMIKCDKNENE
jgi:hypothetical protein